MGPGRRAGKSQQVSKRAQACRGGLHTKARWRQEALWDHQVSRRSKAREECRGQWEGQPGWSQGGQRAGGWGQDGDTEEF